VIISRKYRYVFVQLPHTASTAIGNELCEWYGGLSILGKHSNYYEFLRGASADERTYFTFSSIRNPLDEAVTQYFWMKTNHRQVFSDPKWLRENGGWVTERDLQFYRWVQAERPDFALFLHRFYVLPYDNWSCLSHHRFDFVIRFESLVQDFARLLARLGIQQQRHLPVVNPTLERSPDFLTYYTPPAIPHAVRVFGPFMSEWGYELPAAWGAQRPLWRHRLYFKSLRAVRRIYWGWIRPSPYTWVRNAGHLVRRSLATMYRRKAA
jgi:hypothetical protein